LAQAQASSSSPYSATQSLLDLQPCLALGRRSAAHAEEQTQLQTR